MRELEFLPQWYTQWRRRKRMLVLQIGIVCALSLGLGLWAFLADRNRCSAEEALLAVAGQCQQTNAQLQQMDRLESLGKQWRQQVEVLNRLGLHIESSRLIGKLAAVVPSTVSLLSLDIEIEEFPLPLSAVAKAAMKESGKESPMDRRLRVKLVGVAPTDVELATFLIELNKVPFFERVAPTYARDRRESGHVLREFELGFSVNLNVAAGS